MNLKAITIASLFFLTACSSTSGTGVGAQNSGTAEPELAGAVSGQSPLVPVTSTASSSNNCVDNFNFLRSSKSAKYPELAQENKKINDEFRFLNTNKNIMGNDARQVYTMTLNMKFETLCHKAKYEAYQVMKSKIKQLGGY